MKKFQVFASCPKYIELLLKDELLNLGAEEVSEKLAGVRFTATQQVITRAIMWSRLANRFFIELAEQAVSDQKGLYAAISSIQWSALCNCQISTLSIRFNGTNHALKNSHFSAQVCKDAICDQQMEKYGQRPKVVKSDGHLSVYARLKNKQLTVYQDITGHSLHQRNYRLAGTLAPLKENLAAAVLYRANWPELSQQGYNLVDPMCGSGSFLIEGWMMACDVAPNISYKSHALFSWHAFNAYDWDQLVQEAESRKTTGVQNHRGQIMGVDHHKESVDKANENIARLGEGVKNSLSVSGAE